jgi:hypothetical protein
VGMSTERGHGDGEDGGMPVIVVGLCAIDIVIFPNIWMIVPDSRNRDGPEGRLHASTLVNFPLDASYLRTSA